MSTHSDYFRDHKSVFKIRDEFRGLIFLVRDPQYNVNNTVPNTNSAGYFLVGNFPAGEFPGRKLSGRTFPAGKLSGRRMSVRILAARKMCGRICFRPEKHLAGKCPSWRMFLSENSRPATFPDMCPETSPKTCLTSSCRKTFVVFAAQWPQAPNKFNNK